MKEIKLSQNKVALVDDEDYPLLMKYNWHLGPKQCNSQYAIRHIYKGDKRSTTSMHREIIQVPNGKIIDHIDGNGLNNQKSNLRICTIQNNCMNRNMQYGTSLFKGVSAHNKNWRARIKFNGKIYNLGTFPNEILAAEQYNNAAMLLFGNFAKLNPINKVIQEIKDAGNNQ